MTRHRPLVSWWLFVVALLASGCGGAMATLSGANVEVPGYAKRYSTQARPNGVRGGGSAAEAEKRLNAKLSARGNEADPDGALADTAAWALQRAYAREDLNDANLIAEAARRFGFAGMLQGFFVVPLADEDHRQLMAAMFAGIPSNIPVNRYGIVAGRGSDVAVVVGLVETSLEDFPRAVAPGGKLSLRGEVSERFQRGSVFTTSPSGKIREIPQKNRKLSTDIEFSERGTYSLEIMGYGKPGPVVLLNLPISVGVSESELEVEASDASADITAEGAEAAMLELLNAERKKGGMGPVSADAELRGIALAHSLDMLEHGFVGHVSKTTGAPDDRVRRADVRVSKAGECVALAPSPSAAHRGLLASPAHRVIMLDPSLTHVGIGAAVSKDDTGRTRLHVTLLLGRRVPATEMPRTSQAIVAAIQAIRKAEKLPPLRVDAALSQIADAGTRALKSGQAKDAKQALAASAAELSRVVRKAKAGRVVCQTFNEILETEQLDTLDLLHQAELVNVGVGVVELADSKGSRLGVMIAGEAAPGKSLRCE